MENSAFLLGPCLCQVVCPESTMELFSVFRPQNKDLKSRLAHLEGSQKSSKEGLVSQLEGRIQELEERLEGEER